VPNKTVTIQPVGFSAPVAKAARELESYLPRVAPVSVCVKPGVPGVPKGCGATIVLGTSRHLQGLGLGRLPEEHELDDALAVIPRNGTLYLIGSNGRSVLFAAYRLLEELGVVFLRPGPDGEVVPRHKVLQLPAKAIREKASYRHRGICIEGYPRLEHVLGLLDWMAKKKLNSWHLEFLNAGVYWDRGYQIRPESSRQEYHRKLDQADYEDIDTRTVAAAQERGMLIHRGGHGWTSVLLGYQGTGWYEYSFADVPKERRSWIALVNGKRQLHHGQPSNTELCYSNPEVWAAFIEEALAYARRHAETDFLHVWLSDSYNNNCECEACSRQSPTDWYALLINEIGARLRAERLPMRVVLIAYYNTLWPPQQVKITADNVVFMYAPISRCYRHCITDSNCGDSLDSERPARNEMALPKGNRASADMARRWQGVEMPDSLVFEYYRWAPVWKDGLSLDLADTVYKDMRDYARLGINGVISNDCISAFYPIPISANAMADLLWNSRVPAREHRAATMQAAFGPHASAVEAYLAETRLLFADGACHYVLAAREQTEPDGETLARAARFTSRSRKRFREWARKEANPVIRRGLELLVVHAEHAELLAHAAVGGQRCDAAQVERLRASYGERLPELLDAYGPWIDAKIGETVRRALDAAERKCVQEQPERR